MGKWIFGGLFVGVATVFIAIGSFLVVQQDRVIRNAERTTAVIETSRVNVRTYTKDGRQRTSREAEITYRYRYRGGWKQGKDIQPGMGSPGDADELVGQFPQGREVVAWYDQRDPDTAFLLKRYDFAPYLIVLFPMLHLSVGVAVAAALDRKSAAPMPGRGGWFDLSPETSLRYKRRLSGFLAAVWWGVGGAACGHFFSVAERPHGGLPVIASSIYFGLGLIPLALAWRYWRLSTRVIGEPSVSVDRHPLARGQPVTVRVSAALAGGSSVESATVTLQCRKTVRTRSGNKNSISTSTAWEQSQDFARAQDVMSDRTLTGEVKFTVPDEQCPSTPPEERGYPRFAWRMVVRITQPGPDYISGFGVQVI